jgi:S-disulfanyl-L-cysteine oxidoreductase SoxD
MFKFNASARATVLFAALLNLILLSGVYAQKKQTYSGIGRGATNGEIKAWDIDVRPDFSGLPKGFGSVAKGQEVWESKCASCHGYFGESNQFFNPIIGGTAPSDISSGQVARLRDSSYPQRTTMMKLSSLSTLWDYINRAMPWTNPKTLSTEEVYAVTAYLLNLSAVVADDFVLSHNNIAQVQAKIPNRNGMTTAHALWPDARTFKDATKPDVKAQRCLTDCLTVAAAPRSVLPEYARDAHGNLAEQNRLVGPQRGAITVKANSAAPAVAAVKSVALQAPDTLTESLLTKFNCNACHALNSKLVGPAFADVANKYNGRTDAQNYLSGKIRQGSVGVWGSIAMPAQAIGQVEADSIALWLLGQTPVTTTPTSSNTPSK